MNARSFVGFGRLVRNVRETKSPSPGRYATWRALWVITAATALVAVAGQAGVIDDFEGAGLDTAVWRYFGDPASYAVVNGLLNWHPVDDDWAKSEILTHQVYYLPPPGQTSVVSWVIGPGAITRNNGGTSARIQLGLVSANETSNDSREHWVNSAGGLWIDLPGYAAGTPDEFSVHFFTANDTKTTDSSATMRGEYLIAPYSWQTQGRTIRVEITSEGYRCYDDSTLMYEGTWADADIDTEFYNGFQVFAMGQNYDDGRGRTSLDRVEFENPVLAGLITYFRALPSISTSGSRGETAAGSWARPTGSTSASRTSMSADTVSWPPGPTWTMAAASCTTIPSPRPATRAGS